MSVSLYAMSSVRFKNSRTSRFLIISLGFSISCPYLELAKISSVAVFYVRFAKEPDMPQLQFAKP